MFCLRAPQFNRSFHSWLLKPSTVSVCSLILSMFIELNWDTVAWLLPLHIMIHQNAFQHFSAMGGWELVALIGEVSKLQQHPESSEIGNARATLREKARIAGITQKTLLGLAYCGGCQRTNWCLWALLWRINGAQCCTRAVGADFWIFRCLEHEAQLKCSWKQCDYVKYIMRMW